MLTCLPEPPTPAAGSDAALARYLVDAVEAGRDCRARLAEVGHLLTP
jgi:hypothetical protein